MDMPTFFLALKKSSGGSVLSQAKAYTDAQISAEEIDNDIAYNLLLEALRTHIWDSEENGLKCEEGTKVLSNSLTYPFNNSKASVALSKTQNDTSYVVITDVASANGSAGEIIASEKQTNGFKLEYTGSASSVTVHYIVIGGLDV